MSTWWLPQRRALTNCILAVLVACDDMCEQFEVERRSISVGVLPIQSGTLDGFTLDFAVGFGRVHTVKE